MVMKWKEFDFAINEIRQLIKEAEENPHNTKALLDAFKKAHKIRIELFDGNQNFATTEKDGLVISRDISDDWKIQFGLIYIALARIGFLKEDFHTAVRCVEKALEKLMELRSPLKYSHNGNMPYVSLEIIKIGIAILEKNMATDIKSRVRKCLKEAPAFL